MEVLGPRRRSWRVQLPLVKTVTPARKVHAIRTPSSRRRRIPTALATALCLFVGSALLLMTTRSGSDGSNHHTAVLLSVNTTHVTFPSTPLVPVQILNIPFPATALGSTSTETVNITVPPNYEISGPTQYPSFQYLDTDNTCLSAVGPTNCNVTISFDPSSLGSTDGQFSYFARTIGKPGTVATLEIFVSVIGTAMTISPDQFDFPEQQLNTDSAPMEAVVSLGTNFDFNPSYSFNPGTQQFAVSSDCDSAGPTTCNLNIIYRPTSVLPVSSTLLIPCPVELSCVAGAARSAAIPLYLVGAGGSSSTTGSTTSTFTSTSAGTTSTRTSTTSTSTTSTTISGTPTTGTSNASITGVTGVTGITGATGQTPTGSSTTVSPTTTTTIHLAPTVTIIPDHGPPGTVIAVTSFDGDPPCVEEYVLFDKQRIGEASIPSSGVVHLRGLVVPGNAQEGLQHIVVACGRSGNPPLATKPFLVTRASSHPTELETSIDGPSQIRLDPASIVLGAGLALSLLALALIAAIGFPAEWFNDAWQKRFGNPAEDRQRLWVQVLLYGGFVLFGAALMLLLDRTRLNTGAVWLVVGSVIALVIVTGLFTLTDALYGWRHNRRVELQVLLGSVAVALVCVIVSRVLHFEPGYMYGLIAGFAVVGALAEETEGRLQAAGVLVVLVISLLAWILASVVSPGAPTSHSLGIALTVYAALKVIFLCGLQSAAFGLVPLPFLPGQVIWKWRRAAWIALFMISWLAFVIILLLPNRGFVSHLGYYDLVPVFLPFGSFAVLSIGFIYYCWKHPTKATRFRGLGWARGYPKKA